MESYDPAAAIEAAGNGRADDLAVLLKCRPHSPRELIGLAVTAVCESKSLPTLQVLVDHGWDINMAENYSDPPLLGRAVQMGAGQAMVRWFLDHGADPNAYAGSYMITPLSRAVQFASMDIIHLLLDRGGDATKGELVHYACKRNINDPNTVPLLSLLHGRGAPVDNALFETFHHLGDVTMLNGTPLWQSCVRGNTAAVRFLLAHGANPWRKPWISKDYPLEAARRSGRLEIVGMILQSLAETTPN